MNSTSIELILVNKEDILTKLDCPPLSVDMNSTTTLLMLDNTTCGIERHRLYKMQIHVEYNGGEIISDSVDISKFFSTVVSV